MDHVDTPQDLAEDVQAEGHALRKGSLSIFDAIAQSVALLSLEMGIALSSSVAAGSAGAAAPLAYLVAGVASLCLAYVIIRFTRRMASAGGIYTYIAQGLGPQAGFLGGWMYGGAFAVGISFTLAISSLFFETLLSHAGISLPWFAIFCVLLIALFAFAFFDIRLSTRTQLLVSAIGTLAVLALAIIIVARGGASGLSLAPFSPARLPGGLSSLFFAAIITFTAFIGFEAAAVLGEETARPRVAIPRAILAAILIGMVFYIFVSFALSLGYGVDHAQVWANDQAPLDTLATRYAGPFLATLIDLMVAIGAFVASLAGLVLTTRTMYAMGRDGGLPRQLSWTHPRYKTPWVAIVLCLLITLVLGAALGLPLGPFAYYAFVATTASLGILLAYMLVALSGIVFFLRSRRQTKAGGVALVFDILLPIIAIIICGYTLYSSVYPIPAPPLNYAPYLAAAWLLIGVIILLVLWKRDAERVRHFGKILGE
ncbi:APC family permease [Ktedonosporobacter rubrisoli]|uniref:APC family permease n=1 Tax=Ktedonosporobacter rubrisoli TaxID=2509675 RepID=A0A4P6JNA2_KTERU|nr:APC family permease [Ktedonosporobacter rubrisoli]QBD76570.1 APC family permease [Ktedonosporobacter rubrisoli]